MTADPSSSRIRQLFAALRQRGQCALIPFITAGDPCLDQTAECLRAFQANGADLVELGIPYSDPLADGPVIQAAAARARAAGTTLDGVLTMLDGLQAELTLPLVLFTYANPLLNLGMERFCQRAAAAGASGLVVPDLPLEEARQLSRLAAGQGLDLVLLVAPTTPPDRLARIHQASRGFTYLVSVTGVTGMRSRLEARVSTLIPRLRRHSDLPVAVGFGISGPEQALEVRRWGSDGAIVGSAFVQRIADAVAQGTRPAAAAGRLCAELSAALHD
ncbi:MAG: tryptophan synthase subunit alpha [Aphanocapsa feldmannii 277cV]|uniref:Tryptophan synthase alpha chain n=2 Tax=Aphanocapsa feldmannii TaxID=192050 RepID=A0A524RPW0_9CHRO|nr:MAG: tryptophan synthase subunit alpha [Aphanocapsa feldmannii 277cV]TGH23626.1 MAG: tryptophan synthase subunit alpha [Aphanocapsa feldmannii 277cI]